MAPSSTERPQRRVVVTGMGVVSPVGHDVETFYGNLLEGKSGIGLIESFNTGGWAGAGGAAEGCVGRRPCGGGGERDLFG